MINITNPLEFENEILELQKSLEKLGAELEEDDPTKRAEYEKLESKLTKTRKEVFSKLSNYQKVQLSRHFDRPMASDYIKGIVEDFVEQHGDRAFRDDPAIIGGTGKIGGVPVMIVAQERGHTTKDRLHHNFGMPQPDGYRKALRLFHLAEKFNLPVINLIDTQGAFPGLEAEERGQAEAIAVNLSELAGLKVPVVSVIIGEGGSGGALALGVADRILMFEFSCYSVISPEGCASILWRDAAGFAAQAADALKITATDLKEAGIVDQIIEEPQGGNHWKHKHACSNLKAALLKQVQELKEVPAEELVQQRYDKYRRIGFNQDS